MDIDSTQIIRDEAELDEMYGPALERSVRKQLDRLDDLCRAFIAASPMVIVGRSGPNRRRQLAARRCSGLRQSCR